ncbi:MAG: hypothetical protein AAFX87_10075 [Bacteroidota bacterium]
MKTSNRFTKHFIKKSDFELNDIIDSDSHVEEAKLAATWELERRAKGTQTELQEPEPPKYVMPEYEKKSFRIKMTLVGIAFIGIAIYFNYDMLLLTESSLTRIEGSIEYSKTYVERVSAPDRYRGEYHSNKATLEIKLLEESRVFRIFENIDQREYHKRYNRLTNQLTKGTPVTIWVSEKQIRHRPDFFKLDIKGKTEISMGYTKEKSRFGFLLLTIMGVLFIYLGKKTDWVENMRGFFKN